MQVSIFSDLDALVKDFNHLGASEEAQQIRQTLINTLDQRITELGITPALTGKRVKRKVNNPIWVRKYETAKEIINSVAETGNVDEQQKQALNDLFVWESEEARYTVLSTDTEVKDGLVVLLDSLRDQGIYILSKGAIEEYYPEGINSNCSKPERALKVIERVSTNESAIGLSQPLAEGRPTEFEQIFQSIFD